MRDDIKSGIKTIPPILKTTLKPFLKDIKTIFPETLDQRLPPQPTPLDCNMHSNRILAVSKSPGKQIFEPRETSGGQTNAQRPKRPKAKTLNDHLPPPNWSYRPQTWTKHVSDYPQQFILSSDDLFLKFSGLGSPFLMIICSYDPMIL